MNSNGLVFMVFNWLLKRSFFSRMPTEIVQRSSFPSQSDSSVGLGGESMRKGDSDERLYIFIDLVVGDVLETKASNPSQILPSFHTRSCSWAARCFSSNSAMSRVHRHVASLVLEGRPRARQQGGKGNVHMLLCNNMHALAGIDTGRKTKKLKKR